MGAGCDGCVVVAWGVEDGDVFVRRVVNEDVVEEGAVEDGFSGDCKIDIREERLVEGSACLNFGFESSGRRSNKFLEDLKGGSGLLMRVCATLKFIPKENRAGPTSTQELS